MNTLFDMNAVKQDSPRIAWIKKHGVITYHSLPKDPDYSSWFAGFQKWWPHEKKPHAFFCEETGKYGGSRMGEGKTEEEAIIDLAQGWGIPLWNEEATK